MVTKYLSPKITKSDSVKKSEIFYCVLNFDVHLRKRKNLRKRRVYAGFGADSRTRTDDLRITNELLYQLSHISILDIDNFCEGVQAECYDLNKLPCRLLHCGYCR